MSNGRPRDRHVGADPSRTRAVARPLHGVLLAVAALVCLLVLPGSASAVLQWEGQYLFGPDGKATSSFQSAQSMTYQQAEDKLYVYDSDGKIHGFKRDEPGKLTPLGGQFPIQGVTGGTIADIDVDDTNGSTKGNIYLVPDRFSLPDVFGWNSTGSELPPYNPPGGEKCGVGVDSAGKIWVGNYSFSLLEEYSAAGGEPTGSVETGVQQCNLEVDPTTNNIFGAGFFGNIYRWTKSSSYTASQAIPNSRADSRLAIDPGSNRLYAFAAPCCDFEGKIQVFDTNTLAELESFDPGTNGMKGLAIDESSNTLFLMVGGFSSTKVQEWRQVDVPSVSVGQQTGNEKVSATIAPDGPDPVSECWVEYGTANDPSTFTKSSSCTPGTPYVSEQFATVDLTGTLTGETTYYFRFVAKNANGTRFGPVSSFTPHNVSSLKTEPASEVDRETVQLNASYEGTNEATEYWFEWREGTTGAFAKTAVQNEVATLGPTSLEFDLEDLTAGKTYSYRVAAKNSKGESIADVVQFQTAPAVEGVVTKPAPVADITKTSAKLEGSLDPDGYPTSWYFEWGKTAEYGQAIPLPPGTDLTTITPGSQDVSIVLGDLEPGTEYHYRLVGVNEFGSTVGADEAFTTPQPPSITSVNATNIAAQSADLIATINPNGFATNYYFEYGLTEFYGSRVPVPDGDLPAVSTVKEIVVPIDGLEEKTYHFRLIAENEWGTTITEDQTFDFNVPGGCPNQIMRQRTGAAYTPDCRAYELVSSPSANGTALFSVGPASPYATNPSKFSYGGFLNAIPNSGEPQNAAFGVELYMATRSQEGWTTRYVGVPGSKAIGQSGPPGGEEGSTNVESVCHDHDGEGFECNGDNSPPTSIPGDKFLEHMLVWNRRQVGIAGGTEDGTSAPEVYDNEGNYVQTLPTNQDEIVGAEKTLDEGGWRGAAKIAPDYSHYIFSSIRLAFASGGVVDQPGSVYDNDLATGDVRVISKTEAGLDIPQDPQSGLTDEFLRVPGISDDGSHIVMSSGAGPGPPVNPGRQMTTNNHLYMAVNEGDGTYEHFDISVDKDGKNVGVEYRETTADGSEVFFVTEKKMTADDTDTSRDLFVWSEDAARAGEEPLTRVSDSGNLPGNSDACTAGSWTEKCGVKVVFRKWEFDFDTRMARDTGEIYFYSPEQLDGARGVPNKRNLYVWRDDPSTQEVDKRPQFVAAIDPGSQIERINVSPDGSHAAFVTKTRLTAYDNTGFSEMYHYDPEAREIKCVSCRPDGAPPTSNVAGSTNGLFMSFDGRTFWTTLDALVPRDANGNMDVYEFVQGRPQLITPGTGQDVNNPFQRPGLAAVTGDGIDVYFSTYQTLVPQDENGEVLKFYDARTNGGIPTQLVKPPCAAADECHGEERIAPAPPTVGTSAHLGTNGNFKQAKKKPRKCKKAKAKPKKGKCKSRKAARKRSRRG